MIEAVVFHYGDFQREDGRQHPTDEDMFVGRHTYQEHFRNNFDLDLHISHRINTEATPEWEAVPEVEVDVDPVFVPQPDGSDKFLHHHYRTGDLREYPLVIDKDVHNFQSRIVPNQFTALGLGLDSRFLLNHRLVQEYGNKKEEKILPVLEEAGIALDTFQPTVEGLDVLFEKYGDIEVITKPPGSALSKGVVIHDSLKDVQKAIIEGDVRPDYLLQPYMDTRQPIPGLKPLRIADQDSLDVINGTSDRPREVRMNVGGYIDAQGKQQLWAFPVLRVGQPDDRILKVPSEFFPLDPESAAEGSFMHTKAIRVGQIIMAQTGVRQLYGCVDFSYARLNGSAEAPRDYSFDSNWRCPFMFPESIFAQRALMDMMGTIARNNIDYSDNVAA
jgi:hypothetical protein